MTKIDMYEYNDDISVRQVRYSQRHVYATAEGYLAINTMTKILITTTFLLGRYDTASATYTLQLKDVQRSDEGRYECQIIVGINNKVNLI
jgi:hypothetical protein